MDSRGYTFWGICKGTTKAGSKCRRTVIYANGLCFHHGGDSTEYMQYRASRIAEKAKRRARRLFKKLGIRDHR